MQATRIRSDPNSARGAHTGQPVRSNRDDRAMHCPMTGTEHRLFWMRSAWWCHDCRQKVESCCEGGGCPSIVDAVVAMQPRAASLDAVQRS